MTIEQLRNRIFDFSYSRESLLKLLNEYVFTIEEITEYMNDVSTNKIFEQAEFTKWVHLKRRVKK